MRPIGEIIGWLAPIDSGRCQAPVHRNRNETETVTEQIGRKRRRGAGRRDRSARQCLYCITVDRTHKLLPMITNRMHLSRSPDFFLPLLSLSAPPSVRLRPFFAYAHTTDTRRVLKTRRSTCYPSRFTMHTCLHNAHISFPFFIIICHSSFRPFSSPRCRS